MEMALASKVAEKINRRLITLPQNALSLREIEVLKQASNSHTPTKISPKN